MTTPQCVIIGAGFAGAATAYHLARRGLRNILVLEQESVPGVHSSGRNAAMVRQVVSDPAIAKLAHDGVIQAETIINAAGPWAGTVGRLAGAVEVTLRPGRRHLFVSAPLAWIDPAWSFVWDVSHDLYFRPDSGGLLLCPCDQEEMAPGDPPIDDSIAELLAEKVKRFLPKASDLAIKKHWAGLRTLSADGRFVLGWDPKIGGFFWVAGLGGHGVTTSSSVGALAASLILDGGGEGAEEFSVARFTPYHRTPRMRVRG